MKYSVIKTGGKQYKVSEKDIINVERLDLKAGEEVIFKEVLLVNDDSNLFIGKPILPNVSIKGKVVDNIKGDKIKVFKYKAKARYRKATGHRQKLSKVLIEKIETGKKEPEKEKASVKKHNLKS